MHRPALCLVALFLLAASASGWAICPPGVQFFRYVGNKAADNQCTDDTIQSAIDAVVCPATTVVVSNERTWSNQHLTITGKTFTLAGSNAACGSSVTTGGGGSTPTAPVVTISGNGSQSVFDISGTSNVTFRFVEITGGGGGSGSHGGGINFNGSGSLTIDTSTIDLNHADFGGGIEMNGNGGSATLTLKAYSVIESNTAGTNGGGINLEGSANLLALAPFTTIGFNHAPNGQGGGVAVVGPAEADIGSPGFDAVPVINGNDAARGGGLSAQAVNDDQIPYVNLFTTDAANPITVSGNFASQAGGALYVKPLSGHFSSGAFANACAVNARIDGNSAPEGSAVFLDNDAIAFGDIGSSAFYFNDGLCGSPPPGAVACAPGVICNTLSDNWAVDAGNHPTAGAVVYTNDDAQVFMFRFAMRNNSGGFGMHLLDDFHVLGKCLVADNSFSGEMVRIDDNGDVGSLTVDSCTFANNAHNSGSVIHTAKDLTLTNSILDQPAMSALSTGGTPSINAHNVMASDPTGLPLQEDIVAGEALFVETTNPDVDRRDYHQVAYVQSGTVTSSFGIDFAPAVGSDHDLDGNPYYVDVPAVSDHFGVRDLGCYEARPIADRIFGDALGDPLSLLQ